MSKLIEKCTITVTLDHDHPSVTSAVYAGPHDLEDWVKQAWSSLYPWFTSRRGVRKGRIELMDGAVEVRWEYTGIEEVPELASGDN
jgi:hypothetical protein